MSWDDSVLGWRQNRHFQDYCTVYRPDETINSSTGLVADETLTTVYTGVRCAFTPTSNINDPQGASRILRPQLETEDRLHVHSTVVLKDRDYVVFLTPGALNYGQVYRVQGGAQNLPALGVRNVEESHYLIVALDQRPTNIADPPPDPG